MPALTKPSLHISRSPLSCENAAIQPGEHRPSPAFWQPNPSCAELTLSYGGESSWHGTGELSLCLPKIAPVQSQGSLAVPAVSMGQSGTLILCASPTRMMLKTN